MSTDNTQPEGAVFAACGLPQKLHFAVIDKRYSAGEYFADLQVEEALVVELASHHTAQCLSCPRACARTVCLLVPVNFQGPRVEWHRLAAPYLLKEPPRFRRACLPAEILGPHFSSPGHRRAQAGVEQHTLEGLA